MTIKQLTVEDLYLYQKIPMIKEFDSLIFFDDAHHKTIKKVAKESIDLAKEESIDEWTTLFKNATTGIFVIEQKHKWIAGAIVVTKAPHINMLRNNMSNAVLWDIRVHPDHQSHGLGKKLYDQACLYAKQQHCTNLLIETQNNNPKAINFYISMGALLKENNSHVYKEQPKELQYIFEQSLK